MLNQLSTRQWPLPGYAGDFPFFGPMVVKPVILKTSNSALNVPGVALTFQNGSTTNAVAGGTGVFAGILSNKNTQPYDGNLPTGPVLNIPNDTPTFATSLSTGVYATLSTTARVGDGVAFNTSTGALAAAPGGVAPNGHTVIPGAVIFRRNVDAAGTVGIVQLTNATASSEPILVSTMRQAVTGSYLADTLNAINFHGASSYPFTNKVALPIGSTFEVEFANILVLNNVETNGTGVFTLKGLAVEYGGEIFPATLTKATANGGEIAKATLVLTKAMPAGTIRMNYAYSDTGGLREFPWFTHVANPASKHTFGSASAPTDQVNVLGGGSLNAVTTGQSSAILPTAINAVHSGKVVAIIGSSSGTGRSDTGAPGAGIQSYMTRAFNAAGFPVKNLSVSGQQALFQATNQAFVLSQIASAVGVSHVAIVTGGNDIRGSNRTAAETAGYINTIIDQILAVNPSVKILVCALTPVVTGDFAFVGSQTPHATNPIRVQFNTNLLTNNSVPKAHKLVNVNIAVENVFSPENGRFQPNYTTDGTHLSTLGCVAAAGLPDWAEFMAM